MSTFEDRLKRYISRKPSAYDGIAYWFHMLMVYTVVMGLVRLKCKVKYEGKEHIPKDTPFILASNHVSLWDPPILSAGTGRPIAYMAKKELFENRLKGEAYYALGTFALDRDQPTASTIKTALNVLKSPRNWGLGIFPEGTRSKDGKLQPLKAGVSGLALKCKVPVLPAGIQRKPDTNEFICRFGPVIQAKDIDPETFTEVLTAELNRLIS